MSENKLNLKNKNKEKNQKENPLDQILQEPKQKKMQLFLL